MTGFIRISILAAAALSTVALSGCANSRRSGNVAGVLPDEFRIQARQPLVVPPEYALRPPQLGKPRPQELQPESAARAALVGQPVAARDASQGERLLLAKTGVDASMSNIKSVIDDEYGDITYKSEGFSDRILFWRKDQPQTQTLAGPGATSTPIDPAAEATRIQNLTGGKAVTIVKEPPAADKRKFKLPGL